MSSTAENISIQELNTRMRNIVLEASNLQKELTIRRLKKQLQQSLSVETNLVPANRPVKEQDLTKWTYTDLRAMINSNNEADKDLIKSCREEYQRRMKVYSQWKTQNDLVKTSKLPEEDSETPPKYRSWLTDEESSLIVEIAIADSFYKAPWVRSYGSQTDLITMRGWLYVHFRGETVARYMEVFPGKEPALYTAGKDQILEGDQLSREELGKRQGNTVITRKEFDSEWQRRGGLLTPLDEMLQLADDGQVLFLEHSHENYAV